MNMAVSSVQGLSEKSDGIKPNLMMISLLIWVAIKKTKLMMINTMTGLRAKSLKPPGSQVRRGEGGGFLI
jgi:hypothetical protein